MTAQRVRAFKPRTGCKSIILELARHPSINKRLHYWVFGSELVLGCMDALNSQGWAVVLGMDILGSEVREKIL